jgi:hypothetical protein
MYFEIIADLMKGVYNLIVKMIQILSKFRKNQ